MKYSKITLALAAFAATACAIEVLPETPAENQPEVQLYPMTFTAGADDGSDSETKVTLYDKSVLWAADDQIKVFDGTATPLPAFTIANGAGKTSATFSGSVADPSANKYYALYPYQETATFTSGDIKIGNTDYTSYLTVDLPEEQQAVDGSVDPKAFLALAVSDGNGDFSFKNLNSLVKFRLSESDITNLQSISISSNTLEAIAGNMNVAFNANGVPVQTYVSGQMDSYITLKAPTEGFKANKDYFFAIRSIGFASGLTITAKYTGGTCKHATSTKAPGTSLTRNSVLNLGEIPLVDGLPNDLYIALLHGVLKIAGQRINISNFAQGVKFVNSSQADAEISSVTANAIIFYTQDDNCNFKLKSNIAIAGMTVLCSRYLNSPVNIKTNGKYFKANEGSLFISDIVFDCTLSDTGVIRNYDSSNSQYGTLNYLCIYRCKFSNVKNCFIQMTQNNATFEHIAIMNCNIGFQNVNVDDTNVNNAYLIEANKAVTTASLSLDNNIIYCQSGGNRGGTLFGATVQNNIINDLNITNNSIVGIYPTNAHHYVMINTFTSITQKANYFHLPSYHNFTYKDESSQYTLSIVKAKTNGSIDRVDVTPGYVYYDSRIGNPTTLKAFAIDYKDPNNNTISTYNSILGTNSLCDIDWNEETFTMSESSAYGAQRPQTGSESFSARQTWSGVSEWN